MRREGLAPADATRIGWTAEVVENDDELADVDAVSPLTGAWQLELPHGRLWWSPEIYEMFGETPPAFIPTIENVRARMEPGSRTLLEAQVASWREHPLPFVETYRVVRPDGEHRLLEARGWIDIDCELEPRTMLGTCRDITGMTARRRERLGLARQQEMILRASGDGICGLDAAGRITLTNPAFAAILRRESERLDGCRLHDLVHRDAEGHESHPLGECPFSALTPARTSAIDAEFYRRDGSCIEVGYVRVTVEDDAWRGTVVSLRDITARRAASRLLRTSLQQVQSLSAQRGALLRHLSDAEERERLRIAADIHDDTIQTLGAVALRLSRAGERASGDADRDLLADAEIEVRGVAERLRRLMFELMPPLAGRDLRAAVETYCAIVFADSPIGLEIVGEVELLPTDCSLVAYRLIQEALRNAAKHAKGTRVRISFETSAAELVVRVSDDGVGMESSQIATPPTHAGLRILRQRAEAAGGSAGFGAGLDGRGSSVELRLPIDPEETR